MDELKYDREEWQDASTPMLEQEYKKVSKPDLLDATIALKKAYDDLEAAKDCQILLATATPVKYDLSEIGGLLNLLLPHEHKHPEWKDKETFTSKFTRGRKWIEAKLVELVAMVGPFVSFFSGEHDTSRFSRVYPYGGMTQKEAMAFGLDPVLDGASIDVDGQLLTPVTKGKVRNVFDLVRVKACEE